MEKVSCVTFDMYGLSVIRTVTPLCYNRVFLISVLLTVFPTSPIGKCQAHPLSVEINPLLEEAVTAPPDRRKCSFSVLPPHAVPVHLRSSVLL